MMLPPIPQSAVANDVYDNIPTTLIDHMSFKVLRYMGWKLIRHESALTWGKAFGNRRLLELSEVADMLL